MTEKTVSGPPVQVKGVTLSAAAAAVTAPCPYDLVLNGTLSLNEHGTGPVSAELEATFTSANFNLTPPGKTEFSFLGYEPNPFPFAYTLTFSGNVEGQFRVHGLTPDDLHAETVLFSLTCSNPKPTAAPAEPTATPGPSATPRG